jgi:hypothetical protein
MRPQTFIRSRRDARAALLAHALTLGLTYVWVLGCAHARDEGWIELFNGKDLTGWEPKGGAAQYRVEEGAIVGQSVPNTPNSFLCTTQHYDDFILEFEFKAHPEMNSGVQFRSNSLPEYKDGRVHGYQCELEQENRDRGWSGCVYDEGRRGWLYPPEENEAEGRKLSEQYNRLWKRGDWNHLRIEAHGPRIRIWLNGELRTDFQDDMTPSGFIGLQVHGVGNRAEPMEVRWRNLRLKPLD